MRIRALVLFVALTALICDLFSVTPVTAEKMVTHLDGRVHAVNFSTSVPNQLSYQGCLVNAADSSAVTATLEMTFQLLDSETKGTQLWSETHPTVEVSNGLFQILLGSVTPFPNGLFDGSPLWLQTEVGSEVLAPRKPLVSVAYSHRTNSAEMLLDYTLTDLNDRWVNEADLDHLDAADGDPADAVYVDDSGKVGVGTTSPLTELDVNGSVNATTYYGDGSNLTGIAGTPDADWTVAGNHMYSAVPGSVGVGTSSPENKFHVAGDVKATTYYGDGSNLTGISGTTDNDWTIDGDDIYHPQGNVGIGTMSPKTLLHVSQDATEAPGTHPHTKMIIEDGNSSAYLQIMAPASNTRALLFGESGAGGQVNDGQIGYEDVNGMRFWVDRSGADLIPLQIQMDGDVVMDDGNVGIGTTDPLASLHVLTSDLSLPAEALGGEELCVEAQDAILGLYSSGAGSAGSILSLGEVSGGALVDKWSILRETPTGGSGLRFTYGTSYNPWWNDAIMYLDDNGRVGIGTTSPSAPLDVLGYIHTDLGGDGGTVLKADTEEVIRFSGPGAGSYFLWGYGGTANYFTDPIGIGTSSPNAQLHVRTTGTGETSLFEITNASNNHDALYATTSGTGYSVVGEHSSGARGGLGGSSLCVFGTTTTGTGVSGSVAYGYGIWGHCSDDYGVYGSTSYGYAGYFEDFSGDDYAGWFEGDVHINGTLTGGKTVIDHPLDPENKLLRHNLVESPENLLIYTGKITLDASGEAVVRMPDYFQALTREDEAYIHLTPVGRPFLAGAEWNSGSQSFTVYGDAHRDVFWEVLANRDDPVVRHLERPVVEEKGPDNKLCNRGELLYPTAYGYPENMGRAYKNREEMKKYAPPTVGELELQ